MSYETANETKLNLKGTESRDRHVTEWSPGRPSFEVPVRDILVWPEGEKFADVSITTISLK